MTGTGGAFLAAALGEKKESSGAVHENEGHQRKLVVVGDAREGEDYTTIGQRVVNALRLSLLTFEEGSAKLRVFIACPWKQHMKMFDASVH